MSVEAVFFDFDGVIIDSETVHGKAKKRVLDQYQIPYSSTIFSEFKGRPDKVFFQYVSEYLDPLKRSAEILLEEKNNLFIELVSEIRLVNGFLEFHKQLKRKGIQTAMVSSTSLHSFNLIEEIYHLSDMFDFIVTGADTEHHKPHPEPYLEAFRIINLKTNEVVIIEDAPNGIISAKKAGGFVFGLTSSFSKAELEEAGADITIESYAELTSILKI